MLADSSDEGAFKHVVPPGAYSPDLKESSGASFLKFSSKQYQEEGYLRAKHNRTTSALKNYTVPSSGSGQPSPSSMNLLDSLSQANLNPKRLKGRGDEVGAVYRRRLALFNHVAAVYLGKKIRDARFEYRSILDSPPL